MIDPTTNPDAVEPPDQQLEVASRVRALPPYLFGKINELKYRKRRAGIDVIDLGMGNPTDPPEPLGHRQALRGGARPEEPPLQRRHGRLQPPPRGRRCATRTGSASSSTPSTRSSPTIGSKEGFSHMCLALLGPGRHRHRPRADASRSTSTPSPWPRPTSSRSTCRDPNDFLANVARVCESLYPRPKVLILNYPAQPDGHGRRAGVLRGGRRAGQQYRLHGHPRLRLRRHLLRRLPGAELPLGRRGPRTSASSSRRCPRATTWPAGASASPRATARWSGR